MAWSCIWQGSLADLTRALELEPDNAEWLSALSDMKLRMAGREQVRIIQHCTTMSSRCFPLGHVEQDLHCIA